MSKHQNVAANRGQNPTKYSVRFEKDKALLLTLSIEEGFFFVGKYLQGKPRLAREPDETAGKKLVGHGQYQTQNTRPQKSDENKESIWTNRH